MTMGKEVLPHGDNRKRGKGVNKGWSARDTCRANDVLKRIAAFLRVDHDGPLKDMPLSSLKTLSVIAGLGETVELLTRKIRAAEGSLAAANRRIEELERRHNNKGYRSGEVRGSTSPCEKE